MKNFLHHLSLALVNGYILTFYSEFAFYGQTNDPGTPSPAPGDLLVLWGVYTLAAFLVLTLIRRYRVNNLAALLIVGAAYGWMLEGGIVATAYENLPWSLSFTGLAWHMPIDLLFGWYLVQKWLRAGSFALNLRTAVLSGLVWGFWAVWPAAVMPLRPIRFVGFSLLTVGLLLTAYWLNGKAGLAAFSPSRGEMWGGGVLFLGLFLGGAAFTVPISVLLLPLLLGICWWALRRHARRTAAGTPDLLEELAGRPRPVNMLAWLAFPLTAALEYALWTATGWQVPSNIIGYLLTVPLGIGLFGWALWRIGRSPHTKG